MFLSNLFVITIRLLHTTDIESATLFDELEETPKHQKKRVSQEFNRDRDWLLLQRQIDSLDEDVVCRQFPDAFYPEKGDKDVAYVTSLAKQMCGTCPVRKMCAEYGIRHEEFGIWGGLTQSQRSQIRHPRKDYTPAFLKQAE